MREIRFGCQSSLTPNWITDEARSMAETSYLEPKRLILNAAERLIAEHGYAGFSMRELARESGLASGTIYHHFHDKREIYLRATERGVAQLVSRLGEAANAADTPTGCLRRVIAAYLSLASERRSLILALLRELGSLEEELRDVARRSWDKITGPVAAILREGTDSGSFRDVPMDIAVVALFGTMNTYIGRHLLLNEETLDERAVDEILTFYLHGLAIEGAA